jgi:hypothetical protein
MTRRPCGVLLAVLMLPLPGAAAAAPADAVGSSIRHLRGIYLQQAIEIATVGTTTVRLTRMTKFRRCGRFRGTAEDFNGHVVDVAGREVEGIGFVAGIVDAIEGCSAAAGTLSRQNRRPPRHPTIGASTGSDGEAR